VVRASVRPARRSSSEAPAVRSTVTLTTTSERVARLTRTALTVTVEAAGGLGAAGGAEGGGGACGGPGGGGSGGGGCGGGGWAAPTVNVPCIYACRSQT